MILGFALFYDVLSPATTLCKALQNYELCIVCAEENGLIHVSQF